MPRSPSPRVQKSPGCKPLLTMYQGLLAMNPKPGSWTKIESSFLQAMWAFDQNLETGLANQGDNQNGKGDFFTDVIADLLENCSGKVLHGRGAVPGLIFPTHALDVSYPDKGSVELLIETKAVGAPITARNKKSQKNPNGRPAAADLDKRVKEALFKTIDLKAELARHAAAGGGPTNDLITWLKRSPPLSFFFVAARITDANDLVRAIYFADAANQMMDGVALFAYLPDRKTNSYLPQKVPPHLELDRVLARICTALRALP